MKWKFSGGNGWRLEIRERPEAKSRDADWPTERECAQHYRVDNMDNIDNMTREAQGRRRCVHVCDLKWYDSTYD